jgi:hypothetical protein
MTKSQKKNQPSGNLVLAAVGIALAAVLVTVSLLFWAGWLIVPQTDRQDMVHDMGAHAMPFDLDGTIHVFEMTESGGVQQVMVDDPGDAEQIALIRQHLQHEAARFSSGDFSDPTLLHGGAMPGIQELAAGVEEVAIEYSELSNGAQITFTTQELSLITAIHRWFGAQLSDHGSDATYR